MPYFIMWIICSFLGAIIFIIINRDRKSSEDYILISIASMSIAVAWPLEIVFGLIFFSCVFIDSLKHKLKERKNENKR